MKANIKLFEKKYGREKTNKLALRYCSTFILFLVLAFYSTFGIADAMTAVTTLMMIVLFEVVYGCYMVLSLRLRRLEEKEEEVTKRIKR